MANRIVHLALADARGHLMRAHLLRGLLAPRGIHVDIVTTQGAGAAFLAALGTPSVVLPGRLRMDLDSRHRLRLGRTRRRLLRYAFADLRDDVDVLDEVCAGADLVINDSFHPALLAAHHLLPTLRVVHLHGDNLKRTVASSAQPFRVERWLSHGFAEIIHTLAPVHGPSAGRRVHLPPLVAGLSLHADDVRARWGLHPGAPIAAVYLNPHYSDPSIAALIEAACAQRGLALCGVSEAFAQRPGWHAADANFIDVVAAADVFISGAGMGAVEQARVTGTPLVCVLGQQDEQRHNASERGLLHVQLGGREANARAQEHLHSALEALPEKRVLDAKDEIARVHALWTATCERLLKEARHDDVRDQQHRPRDRNQQPARGRRRQRLAFARALVATPAPPNGAAGQAR